MSSINNINDLYGYISSNKITSFDAINKNLTLSKSFMINNYISEKLFDILVEYDYDVLVMKTKIFQYLDHIEKQKDNTLNNLLFIPFIMRHSSKGEPMYEQEKHYDNGYRAYRSYIYGYEYRAIPTSNVDKYKIANIRNLFSIFFDIKLYFQHKLNNHCVNKIFSYLNKNDNIYEKIVWKLKRITYEDKESKYMYN